MKMEVIRGIAKSHDIYPGKLSKLELIKSIQLEEGNFDCYGTATSGECDQSDCSWREDCFAAARAGVPS